MALCLRGWIRNRPDGTVESVVEGSPDAVERFVLWCRKGPVGARVEEVRQEVLVAEEPLARFEIRYR